MTEAYDVVVLGGGAAGLMCALTAGQRGRRVLLIEHANRVGKKILMSGGGRCNFTNTGTTPENFLSANPHFAKSALARYSPGDFIAMVDAHGIAWHEKELGQLFCDVSSKQIVAMLLAECEAGAVRIETSCSFDRVQQLADGFAVDTAAASYRAPAVVVATGGLSIPRMGATGIGYALARQFGHRVLPTRAGLVPLTMSGRPLEAAAALVGVALPVRASCGGRWFEHSLLFTHRGLSGPAILQISSYWQPGDALTLDLLPDIDAASTVENARRDRPDATVSTVLAQWLPKRLAQQIADGFGNQPMRQLDPPDRAALAARLGDWHPIPNGTEGYRTAEVTLGGVDTAELSSATMASKRVPNLYFIGEAVDVTGWLGGYNFQWAWASGRAAGLAL